MCSIPKCLILILCSQMICIKMSINFVLILPPKELDRKAFFGLIVYIQVNKFSVMWGQDREHSGSVVECLTRDRRVAGSSLTGLTALWSLSKTHLS